MNEKSRKYSVTSQKPDVNSNNKHRKSQTTRFENNSNKSEPTKQNGGRGYNGQQQNGNKGESTNSTKFDKSSDFSSHEIFGTSATPGPSYSKISTSTNKTFGILKKGKESLPKPTIIIRELQVGVDTETNEPLTVLAADDPSTCARIVCGHPSMSSLGHQKENKCNKCNKVQDSECLKAQEVHQQTSDSYIKFLNKVQSEDYEIQGISDLPLSEAENICKRIVNDAMTEATSLELNSKSTYQDPESRQILQKNFGDPHDSKGRNPENIQHSLSLEEKICQSIFNEMITVAIGGDKVIMSGQSFQHTHKTGKQHPRREQEITPFQSDENVSPVDPKNECEDCDYWPPRKRRKKPSQSKAEKPKKQCVHWGKCQQQQEGEQEKPEWQFLLTTSLKYRGKEPMREMLKKKNVDGTQGQELDSNLFTEQFQLAHTTINLKGMEIPKIVNPETRSDNHEGIQENEIHARTPTDRCQSDIEQEIKESHSRHNSTPLIHSSSGRSERSFVRGVARKYKGFIQAVLKRFKRKRG